MAAGQNIELESVFTYRKPLLADFFTRYYKKVAELLIYGRTYEYNNIDNQLDATITVY